MWWECRYFQILDIKSCNTIKKSVLNWKWGRCSLNRSKTIFLRTELPERVDNFLCLILCCSFSTLSRWPITFSNQQISIRLPLISTQKLSINENNLSQYFSTSKSRHLISVSFKLQSYFFWNLFEVPPTQNPFLATKPFGIRWKDLHISKKRYDRKFCDNFWFLETGFSIAFTFLLRYENIWLGEIL